VFYYFYIYCSFLQLDFWKLSLIICYLFDDFSLSLSCRLKTLSLFVSRDDDDDDADVFLHKTIIN